MGAAKMRNIILLLAVVIASAANALHLDISVDHSGIVDIKSDSVYWAVEGSPDYTDKDGKYWLLNISDGKVYPEIDYQVHLPKGAVVNYIKAPAVEQIGSASGLMLSGDAKNRRLEIIVQYSLSGDGILSYAIFIFVALSAIAAALFLFLRPGSAEEPKGMTERQKEIYRIIKRAGKPVSQRAIERKTGYPKSSVSRNVDSMVRRGILEREQKGMSRFLYIKPGKTGRNRT